MNRWIVTVMALVLVLTVTTAAPAQEAPKQDPRVEIMDFYSFDPTLGKQHEYAEYAWPSQHEAGALVRFETTGYSERKSISVFFVVSDRYGELVYKDTQELTLHAGQHEWIMPYSLDISRLYGDYRFNIRTEIKLTGANRVEDTTEIVIHGPKMPGIKFSDLSLEDPTTGEVLNRLKPRQLAMIKGTIEVTGNTTPHLPSLLVYGLMSKDNLQVDDWQAMPFCDLYWDQAQFDAPNGKWDLVIETRMPEKFVENTVESQPFEITLLVGFTPEHYATEVIAGTVMASGTGMLVGKDLGDRLLQIERNWYWELNPAN